MATDSELLLVRIEANLRQFERQMQKANGTADKAARSIERRFKSMEQNVGRSGMALSRSLLGPIAALASGREILRAADSFTRIENALKIAGLEGEALTATFEQLYEIAQRNSAPVESLAQLYSRLSQVQGELGVSSEQLLRFTNGVAAALKVQGTPVEEARGALLQLSQALSGTVVRAEEFNSINEGATPILKAVANGLVEAGGSIAKLRSLVIDGKVSSQAFFRAFEAGQGTLEALAETAETTVGQSFERLRNTITRAIGNFDKEVGGTQRLSDGLDAVGEAVERFMGWLIRAEPVLSQFGAAMGDVIGRLDKGARVLGRDLGTQNIGEALGVTDEVNNRIQDSIDLIESKTKAHTDLTAALQKKAVLAGGDLVAAPDPNKPAPLRARVTPDIKPVSLADFAVPDDGKSKRARAEKKTPEQTFGEDLERLRERTAALQLDTRLVGENTFEREKALAAFDLENEAKRAGVALTPELSAQINELSTAYANATVELEAMQQAEQDAISRMDDFRDSARDVLGGFVSDIREGITAAEALGNALNRIADKLIDMALDNAISSLLGGAGTASGGALGGGLGGLVGKFLGGGAASPSAMPSVPRLASSMKSQSPGLVQVQVVAGEFFDARVAQTSGAVSATMIKTSNKAAPGMMANRQARGI